MGHDPASRTGANIFADLPDNLEAEIFETILARPEVRIERIVSRGQATKPGEWYDQEWDEWVLLLSGSAALLIDGDQEAHTLMPGDYLMLPAHCRHRVEWTEPDSDTIWLAIHFEPAGSTSCVLWRQDDNGNRFPVGRFARREDAEQKMNELTRQIHKQIYWISNAADPEKGE